MGVAVVCMNGWDHTCCFKTTSQPISGGANFRFLWKRSGLHWSGSALAEHIRATIPVWKCKETGRELALGNSVVLIIMPTNYNLYSKQFETLCDNGSTNDCILFLLTIYTVSQLFLRMESRVGFAGSIGCSKSRLVLTQTRGRCVYCETLATKSKKRCHLSTHSSYFLIFSVHDESYVAKYWGFFVL